MQPYLMKDVIRYDIKTNFHHNSRTLCNKNISNFFPVIFQSQCVQQGENSINNLIMFSLFFSHKEGSVFQEYLATIIFHYVGVHCIKPWTVQNKLIIERKQTRCA